MNDPLNDPAFPNRPSHPDFWKLSNIILGLDATTTDDPDSFESIISDVVDPDSISYQSMQRAMRAVAISHGIDPSKGTVPRDLLVKNQHTLLAMSAIYMEAFIVGARFAKEGSDGS